MDIQQTNLNNVKNLNSINSGINRNNVSFGTAISYQLDHFLRSTYPDVEKGIRKQVQDHLAAFCDGITNLFDKFQDRTKIDLRSRYKNMLEQTETLVSKLGLSTSNFEFISLQPIKEGIGLTLRHKDSGKGELVKLVTPESEKGKIIYDVITKDESGHLISFSELIDKHFPDFSKGSTQDIKDEIYPGMYLCDDPEKSDKFWNPACELFNSLINQFKELNRIQEAEEGFNKNWLNRHT